jgi:hypothetical protein
VNGDSDSAEAALSLSKARAVLLEIAQDETLREDFSLISDFITPNDLQQIIELAWRHQFDDDRSEFKKAIGKLQEHVCAKAMGD